MKENRPIFISTSTFAEFDKEPLNTLKKGGCTPVLNPHKRKLTAEELIALAQDAVGLIAGTEILNKDVLAALPKLKTISRCGVGLENVDLRAAMDRGVKVFNTPDSPTTAVAELTIGILLSLLRKIVLSDRNIRSGQWKKLAGSLLNGKRIGIIGFGRIGRKVADLCKAFECEVGFSDPFAKVTDQKFKRFSLDELLAWADIISVHAATGEEIIGENQFGKMKKGSFLINVSRGEVVNEAALIKVLTQGHLAGAALDVFLKEPYDGDLKEFDNVVLTPHIGSYAQEARVLMELEAVKNLLTGLNLTVDGA